MKKLVIAATCFLLLALVIALGVVLLRTKGTGAREVSNLNPEPGEVITVTVEPPRVEGFYAVKEDINGLEYIREHTADSNPEDTTFTNLTPKSFEYKVKVPEDAKPGDRFVITGEFWTDPKDKKDIGRTALTVAGAP